MLLARCQKRSSNVLPIANCSILLSSGEYCTGHGSGPCHEGFQVPYFHIYPDPNMPLRKWVWYITIQHSVRLLPDDNILHISCAVTTCAYKWLVVPGGRWIKGRQGTLSGLICNAPLTPVRRMLHPPIPANQEANCLIASSGGPSASLNTHISRVLGSSREQVVFSIDDDWITCMVMRTFLHQRCECLVYTPHWTSRLTHSMVISLPTANLLLGSLYLLQHVALSTQLCI